MSEPTEAALLRWIEELLVAQSLAELADVAAAPPSAAGAASRVSLVLADPGHELRLLAFGTEVPAEPQPGLLFVDSLVGVASQSALVQTPWCGEFRAADHALLLPGAAGLAQLLMLPLRRGTRVFGIYCVASATARPWLGGLGASWLDHVAAVLAASIERLFDRARLLRSGLTDPLTGWNSRRYLQARLAEEIARCERHGSGAACVIVDVDRLQQVNERFGLPAGDRVLREAGARIEAQVRASDAFAHLGSDEFAVLLPQTEAALAVPLASRILNAFRAAPFEVTPQAVREVRVSIGIAGLAGGAAVSDRKALADQWLAAAAAALHGAKRRGGDCFEISSAGVTSATGTPGLPPAR